MPVIGGLEKSQWAVFNNLFQITKKWQRLCTSPCIMHIPWYVAPGPWEAVLVTIERGLLARALAKNYIYCRLRKHKREGTTTKKHCYLYLMPGQFDKMETKRCKQQVSARIKIGAIKKNNLSEDVTPQLIWRRHCVMLFYFVKHLPNNNANIIDFDICFSTPIIGIVLN